MLFSEIANKLSEYMVSIDRSPITIEVYRRDLGYIRKFLEERKNGPVYIEDVTQEDLEAFMRYVKEVKQYSANTRSNYFYTLRSFYAFAYKKGLVERNIAASMDFMRMPKIERNYLAKQEVEAIIEEIESPLIKLMVTFLFNTGLRISECLHLTLDDEMLKNIMPLLKRLQNAEYQPAVSETKNIPRYQVKGMYGTKAMRMANVLDELARRFSMERNISQREMFEVAVIEFFQKYGYREEVEGFLLE